MPTTATYTKLRSGYWGVRGYGLTEGQAVAVTTKSGKVKTETVARILWTAPDGLSIARTAPRARSTSRGRGPAYHGDELDYEADDRPIDGVGFADPGGRSALRRATRRNPRIYPCPTCGRPNVLTPADKARGYQCDQCADHDEGVSYGMEGY